MSQASQAAAAKLLSPVLGCLTAHYPQDQFAPHPGSSNPPTPTPSAQGVQVEEWLGSKAVEGRTAQLKPKWHQPTPAEMHFAEELMQTFMIDASKQLQQIGEECSQGGKYKKEQIQGLLLQIEGTVHGLRSALADFVPPVEAQQSSGQGSGQGLSLIGAAAPLVGGLDARDAVAKSLIAAAGFVGANDYETLGILLRVMSGVLSRGAHEFQEANDSFSSWKSDQDVAFDPPIAALLFDQVHQKLRTCAGKLILLPRHKPNKFRFFDCLHVSTLCLARLWQVKAFARQGQAYDQQLHSSNAMQKVCVLFGMGLEQRKGRKEKQNNRKDRKRQTGRIHQHAEEHNPLLLHLQGHDM